MLDSVKTKYACNLSGIYKKFEWQSICNICKITLNIKGIIFEQGFGQYEMKHEYYLHDIMLGNVACNRTNLGLRPTNERRWYFVTTFLIGWAQA